MGKMNKIKTLDSETIIQILEYMNRRSKQTKKETRNKQERKITHKGIDFTVKANDSIYTSLNNHSLDSFHHGFVSNFDWHSIFFLLCYTLNR